MAYQKKQTSTETIETGTVVEKEPYNCLRKERIIVRFIPKQTGIVTDKDHVLYGGMAENSKRSFVVPKTANGYVRVLTDDEQECLEDVMGLKRGTLNANNKEDNFWDDANEKGINRVYLQKQDNYFDLSNPEDYIKYKILLANKNIICPSQTVLQNMPRTTYQFVIISDGVEADMAASKLNTNIKAWMEVGKIQENIDKMRVVLSILEKKPVSPTSKIGFLQTKLNDYVKEDPKAFLKIVQDKYFDTRVTIQKAIDRGIIVKRGTYYYDKETNSPLCENGEDPTLNVVCKYLNSAKNDSVKFAIEKKIAES